MPICFSLQSSFRTLFAATIIILATNFLSVAQVHLTAIDHNWSFKQVGDSVWREATVPGCVHTDLMAQHLIGDPYYRDNEKNMQWIGEKDWDYQTTIAADHDLLDKDNVDLVFEGLDTYADVYINDVLSLHADNMHRQWRINCKRLLHQGENKLTIRFKSIFKIDIPKYLDAPFKLQAFPNNDQSDIYLSLYARKAGYEYGWDWGPRLITSGIWRPVYIQSWNNAKINNVQVIQQNINAKTAKLSAVYAIQASAPQNVLLTVADHGKILAKMAVVLKTGLNPVQLDFEIPKPKLWWPNGLGKPNLYQLDYSMSAGGTVLDAKSVNTGIRSVKVIRKNNEKGTSFYFEVNGIPVFIKGSNYIPIDNFLNRVTQERYEAVIKSAKDAHMNMLRVWGGGIYENDVFYDLCDKNGILVWQDLMFACGMFPSDKEYIDNVKQEVAENISRLRNHPSIALWCGNNENEIGWYRWGWRDKYSATIQKKYEATMNQLFHAIIPALIAEFDTTRYYHPSSPSTGYSGIDKSTGDSHYYGVWSSGEPFSAYNTNVARFMSEYGFQSFPEYSTIAQFTKPEDQDINSSVMLSHQRAKDNETRGDFGNKNISTYMNKYYRQPSDFKKFLYVSQLLQAKGIVTAIEAHRRNMPYCMGTMYWQINDCWPVASWSSTDYYGNWKALHYAVKKAYQTELIALVNNNNKISLYIATDRLKQISPVLKIKLIDFNGKTLWESSRVISLKPNSSQVYFEMEQSALIKGHRLEDLVLSVNMVNGAEQLATKNYYFKEEKYLDLQVPSIEKTLSVSNGSVILRVKSDKLVKNLYLNIPGVNASYEDNYFDLIPGEIKEVRIKSNDKHSITLDQISMISLIDSYKLEVK